MRWNHEYTDYCHSQPKRWCRQNNHLCQSWNWSGAVREEVLLIDGDPQGSLTISLGNPQPDKLPFTLSDAMGRILMDEPIRPGEGILHHPEGVDWCCGHPAIWYGGISGKRYEPRNHSATISGHAEGAILPYPYWLPALPGYAYGQCTGCR